MDQQADSLLTFFKIRNRFMKILVFGATGDVGGAIIKEANQRGHKVTGCARNIKHLIGSGIQFEALDVLQEQQNLERLMGENNVAVSALRPVSGQEHKLVGLTQTVLKAARIAGRPIFITGGAGVLKIGNGTDHTVLSAPGFLPDAVRPIAEACAAQDKLLDDFSDVDWTCLRPAAMLVHKSRTGRYALGRDELIKQEDGQSQISYADFAVTMLDLIELQPSPRQRLTSGW
ncbi:MAG: NAD(P)H-binding protein [Devosiaceae bacterium]|nr:NAD(P)H-binding protein [Devosiaceae bacterium]